MSEQAALPTAATICEEVIHYPSEDYPCLCDRLVLDDLGRICMECGHDATMHRGIPTPSA